MSDTSQKELSKHFLSRLYEKVKTFFKDSDFTPDIFEGFVKDARSHAGGKQKAENKLSTASETLFLEERKFAEGRGSGWMIGFFLNADTAAKLAIPGGEKVEDLHVTLCYLGELSLFDRLVVARALVEFERFFNWREPVSGEVSGLGRFQTSDGVDVIYASVDIPNLSELRADLVRALASVGVKPENEHGFDPHITLAYIPSEDPTPEWNVGEIPIRFDRATSAMGDERVEVAMKGGYYAYGEDGRTIELADLTSKNHGLTRFFNELNQFAEPPDWIPYLPTPGKYTSPVYGEILITKERNENFVSNFDNCVYQEKLPIDAEHETKLSGALGWITGMRINSDGSVDAKAEWTDRGEKLIEADRFKYFSPEWFEQWSDPATGDVFKDVAVGGALTTRPFFKEKALRPLVANERGLFEVNGEVNDESSNINFSLEALIASTTNEVKGAETMTTPAATTTAPATDDKSTVTTQQFAEMQTQLKAAEAAAEANKKAAEAAQEEAKKASERVAALEKDARTNRFSEQAKAFPGDATKQVTFMEKLAETFGENSEELKDYIEQQTALGEQLRTSNLFKEAGKSGSGGATSAQAQAEAKARKFMEEDKNLNYNDALSRVFAEDNSLYERYTKETTVKV